MKKWISLSLAFVLVLSLLAGCAAGGGGEADGNAQEGAGGPEASELRVGMVTDFGGVNDNSFNQSAWEGLQQLSQQSGITVDYLQSTTDADYTPNLNTFVQDGWDLTWGIGYLLDKAVNEVASQNPNAKLGIIDGMVDQPNVASVLFKEHEGSYLVGIVAGLMTKTNQIGFVGGMDIPVIKRFEAGFKEGIKAVKPDAKVIVNYVGSFSDAGQGKAAAATMYNQGADIIFHASGATGDGVFNEAQEQRTAGKDVWVIGVDKDQSITFGDDITLTSMMKRVDEAIVTVTQTFVDGTFKGGVVNLGLAENGVGLPEDNSNVPQEVLDKVKEYTDKIVAGEIKVPEVPAQ